MRRFLLLPMLALLAAAAGAQPQLTVIPSTRTATVGERIELRVIIRGTAAGTAAIVRLAPGDYELLEEKTLAVPSNPADRGVIERQLTIAVFRTGEISIGPIQVELHGAGGFSETLNAPAVPLTIRSVLTPQDRDIRPLNSLAEIRGSPLRLLPWLLGVLALIAIIGLFFWWRHTRRHPAAVTPPLPPEEELAAALSALLARQLPESGEHRLFFIELSAMAKRFLARFYDYNVEDLTSSETVAGLIEREPHTTVVNEFDRLLQTADLVKFARLTPEPQIMNHIVSGCRALVEGFRQRRRIAESIPHDTPES